MNGDKSIEKVIREIENNPDIKKLPEPIKNLLKNSLERMNKIPFPVITFKENDWILATTPVLDLSAQGKTEKEAIENLEAMIDDYMTDKDTVKPEIKSIINMDVCMKSVPVTLPLNKLGGVVCHSRQNTRPSAK